MMVRHVAIAGLLALTLVSAVLGQPADAHQEDAGILLPGVTVETLGRRQGAGMDGDDLVLLWLTLKPGASLPDFHDVRAAVLSIESGWVDLEVARGEADVILSGDRGRISLSPGESLPLSPGDALTFGDDADLAIHNASDVEATILAALTITPRAPLFVDTRSGSFSVETFACPAGMTLATLDPEVCQPASEPLVRWRLASEAFDAPLGAEAATITGATTTWDGLPDGAYFVGLTAESFAPGYGDYFVPSSNQVTRQDERTTRIYLNASEARGAIRVYVFRR
jgi:hypothetical protein